MTGSPESIWSEILSEDPARVLGALRGMGESERQAALAHLRRMAEEDGWSEAQSRRARAALAITAADPPETTHPSES
ncbi:MAG: hypothetical protein FJZ97_03395 [Chloroflexi bacterium]|nr:hypothetical protein [Chloroflexota bacterium]